MALTERLALLVSLDADGAIRGLNNVGKAADRNLGKTQNRIDMTAQKMQKAGVGMMGAAGLAGVALYKAGQSAADLEQAIGGTEAVFKDSSGTIERFAKDSARNMGLSERAFREATTSIGGQLKGLGFDTDDAADKAVELTGVAADLAATYGGTTAEAVQALGAAFRGEADPAERFNLRLNQNTVNAKAVALGLAETTSKVDAQAKAQATLALITEQSADATGQFAREQDSASGAMQIANAEFENAKAALGGAVAPIMADIAEKAAGLAQGFSTLNEKSGGLASTLATYATIGLAAGGGLLYIAGKALEMRDAFGKLRGLSGLKGTLAGIGTAVAGLAAAWALYSEVISSAKDEGRAAVDDIRTQFAGLDPAKTSMEDLRNVIGGLDADLAKLREDKAGSNAPWDADYRAELGASIAAGEEFRAELAEQAEAASVLAGEIGVSETAALRMIQTNQDVASAAEVGADGFDTEALAASGLTAQIEELNDALKAQFDPLFAAQDAALDLADAQTAVTDAEKEFGTNSREALDARRELTRSTLDYESSLLDMQAAIESGDLSLDDSVATLNRWVDQGLISQQAADEAAYSFGILAANAKSVPDNVSTTVKTPGADVAAQKLRTIQILLGQIPNTVGVRVDASYAGPSYRRAHGGPIYRAPGGPVGTDTVPAWLTPGEFVMQKSAVDRIGMTNLSMMNATGTAGSSATVNIYVSGSDPQRVVEAVSKYIKSNGEPAWLRA